MERCRLSPRPKEGKGFFGLLGGVDSPLTRVDCADDRAGKQMLVAIGAACGMFMPMPVNVAIASSKARASLRARRSTAETPPSRCARHRGSIRSMMSFAGTSWRMARAPVSTWAPMVSSSRCGTTPPLGALEA